MRSVIVRESNVAAIEGERERWGEREREVGRGIVFLRALSHLQFRNRSYDAREAMVALYVYQVLEEVKRVYNQL